MSLNMFIPKQIRVLGSIRVKVKTSYGVERNYPDCELSNQFAMFAGTKTLTEEHLKKIEAMGFKIEREVV